MFDVEVISDPAAASVALDPVRSRILASLHEPASAATLADRLAIPRQKINYHLRALESHGLVREESTRRWGGLIERRMVATAVSYMVSPHALGPAGSDPSRTVDRLSAGYLIALAARVVREVGSLMKKAAIVDKRLPTLSIDAEISFRSPAEGAAFANELTEAITRLAAKYHVSSAPNGLKNRLVVVAHPIPIEPALSEDALQ